MSSQQDCISFFYLCRAARPRSTFPSVAWGPQAILVFYLTRRRCLRTRRARKGLVRATREASCPHLFQAEERASAHARLVVVIPDPCAAQSLRFFVKRASNWFENKWGCLTMSDPHSERLKITGGCARRTRIMCRLQVQVLKYYVKTCQITECPKSHCAKVRAYCSACDHLPGCAAPIYVSLRPEGNVCCCFNNKAWGPQASDHLICKISSGMSQKSSSFEEFNGFRKTDVHFFE